MATKIALSANDLRDRGFWQAEFPQLKLSDGIDSSRFAVDPNYRDHDRASDARHMAHDGYIRGAHPELETLAPRLAEATRRFVELRLPPVFLFLFDEAWECFYALSPRLTRFLGSPLWALPDFWVWHVDPAQGDAGWAPHVDKGSLSLSPEGRPLSATVWIPLTSANPLNSCIYVLPASRDPEYGVTPDQRRIGLDVTQMRALPAEPGEWLCWNQAILHWGSATSRFAEEPRISMALEFQSSSVAPFNEPLIRDPRELTFDLRLKLVAKQILQYRHMYAVDPAIEELAKSILPDFRD